jgi:hypothetical protein
MDDTARKPTPLAMRIVFFFQCNHPTEGVASGFRPLFAMSSGVKGVVSTNRSDGRGCGLGEVVANSGFE